VVILIVVTAGMVSTTWVQFIKGTLLVVLCTILVGMILIKGHRSQADHRSDDPTHRNRHYEITYDKMRQLYPWGLNIGLAADVYGDSRTTQQKPPPPLEAKGEWAKKPYLRFPKPDGGILVVRKDDGYGHMVLCQMAKTVDGKKFINGLPQKRGEVEFERVGEIYKLPGDQLVTGPIGPTGYLATLQDSEVIVTGTEKFKDDDGNEVTIYYPKLMKGSDLMVPGGSPTFAGIKSDKWIDKLDFISLMLALFCGTASLPHILIRYYTVKDQRAARLSTIVGIASIGVFYILTLYVGLAAMTSLVLDPSSSNMAAPLLARSFGEWMFAAVSAVAFTTVLGTVSGLILAASGAVAHDLMSHGLGMKLDDNAKVRVAKTAAVVVGLIAIGLGIMFEKFNVTFLVGWAFNIAASANLPALIMLLFWKRTTKEGIIAGILVGLCSSLGWVLASKDAYKDLYGWPADQALVPFSQPGIVTIPLGFLTLIVVSLMTKKPESEVPA
jgi:cation/acetate symporter